jgi:crotonobetainyl-CoA:carnitine CoA-transferase CaiB-like acyl-CoA transferase
MTIAGGMMGALFHRERTGEATVVDVSLLGSAMWAMGQAVALSLLMNEPWVPSPAPSLRRNPLVNNYLTKDGRYISLCCLQGGKYWAPMCEAIGQPNLSDDPRFADLESLLANSAAAIAILEATFAERPLAEWRERLAEFIGQWTVVQNTLELAEDPQVLANGYIQECQTANQTEFRLAAAPVQFDEEAPVPGRAPEFNEHGDTILAELGLDWDTIVDLKVRGVVA